ncbi:SRPBCC domain-containing protein [Longimicrobium sp.]|uniref:SRPBCC family protein n=1 Tax=Longimicrobium sp. TaxID=2029185 RepID=UPI002E31C7F4|nr:SRPBCC domain-containing protein [Longimicrobium sp.]HEX6040955.1 SRPBCC domain-containing protein [Longimicrobium sp.]
MAENGTQAANEVSDEALVNATGRSWEEWAAVLDARGAAELPHGKIVALLADGLIESSWWRQTVTVGYARRKGARAVGETAATGFQVGVRRTLPLAPADAWRLVTSPDGVRAWLGDSRDLAWERGAAYTAADGASGEVRVIKPDSHVRVTRHAPGRERASTIQVRVIPAAAGTTLSFHEEHLPGADAREERRRHYDAVLDRLAELVGANE